MKVLIVEDELLAAERLQTLLLELLPDLQVVGVLDSVEEAVAFFREKKEVDIVMLDIELADGKCFSLFDQVNVDVPVIFITAYDHYALQAFQFLSIDYLLKPVQAEALKNALAKFSRLTRASGSEEIQLVRRILTSPKRTYRERFLIKSGNRLQFRYARDVAYFFADGKIVYLVTKGDNRRFIIDHTLEELEEVLDPGVFFRISRKFIICVDCLQEVKSTFGGKLELKMNQECSHELSVSRERANEFKEWLNR